MEKWQLGVTHALILEIALGLRTAYARTSHGGRERGLTYGTSDGAAAQILLSLDMLLFVSPWRTLPRELPRWLYRRLGVKHLIERVLSDTPTPNA